MLRRTRATTLDRAGYTYNPFTTMDTFGQPTGLNLTALEQHNLPIGADNSAIPELGHPSLRNGSPHIGSDTSGKWNNTRAAMAKQQLNSDANISLLAFIVILVLALRAR